IRQAAFDTFQRREAAAFLLDEIVLDAAAVFGRLEDRRPRRHALAKQHLVALVRRPILTVNAADAAGAGANPRHRVGAGFDAGADVELEHYVGGRIGGDDLDGALALDGSEFQLMVVIAGGHAERLQFGGGFGQLRGDGLPAIEAVGLAGAGPDDVLRAENLIELDRFANAFGGQRIAAIVGRVAANAERVHQLAHLLGIV